MCKKTLLRACVWVFRNKVVRVVFALFHKTRKVNVSNRNSEVELKSYYVFFHMVEKKRSGIYGDKAEKGYLGIDIVDISGNSLYILFIIFL